MPIGKASILVVTLVGLASMLACKDRDKQQTDGSKAVASTPSPTQQSEGTLDADDVGEGEEGSAAPAAVASEQQAPRQIAGKQFVYNFDTDAPGQLPAKFHSAKTGAGAAEKWVVSADPTAPSKPNVVTQTSTDQTDYRFPLLISDEGSFQDRILASSSRQSRGTLTEQRDWFFGSKTRTTTTSFAPTRWKTTIGCIPWSMVGAASSPEPTSKSPQENGTNCV